MTLHAATIPSSLSLYPSFLLLMMPTSPTARKAASHSRPLHQLPATVLLSCLWDARAVIPATLTRGALLNDLLSGGPLQQPEATPEITEGYEKH